jgi:hypothetical protein
MRPEKSTKLGWIDSFQTTTEHGTNYRCKLVIEINTLMLYVWWVAQEIS